MFEALYASKVPSQWLKTYPSIKPLGPWTRDLLLRIEQLATWVADTYPRVYWLSGFTYPTGFLTAVLQVGGGKWGRRSVGVRGALTRVPGQPYVGMPCATWVAEAQLACQGCQVLRSPLVCSSALTDWEANAEKLVGRGTPGRFTSGLVLVCDLLLWPPHCPRRRPPRVATACPLTV